MPVLARTGGSRFFENAPLLTINTYRRLLFWVLWCLQASPLCLGACPNDVVAAANNCMTDYSTHQQLMQTSKLKLFAGVDVETLRLFCSGYRNSMNCIERIKQNCPTSVYRDIDNVLINLHGGEGPLNNLCTDDQLYEVYARHRACFEKKGAANEYCFISIMNASVHLLTTFDERPIEQLCREVSDVTDCIKNNIRKACGPEAEGIVEKLVKPMVRRSTECDYVVIPATNQPGRSQHNVGYESRQQTTENGDNEGKKNTASRHRHSMCISLLCILNVMLLKVLT